MTPARLARMKPRFRKRWLARCRRKSIAACRDLLGRCDRWSDPHLADYRRWLDGYRDSWDYDPRWGFNE